MQRRGGRADTRGQRCAGTTTRWLLVATSPACSAAGWRKTSQRWRRDELKRETATTGGYRAQVLLSFYLLYSETTTKVATSAHENQIVNVTCPLIFTHFIHRLVAVSDETVWKFHITIIAELLKCAENINVIVSSLVALTRRWSRRVPKLFFDIFTSNLNEKYAEKHKNKLCNILTAPQWNTSYLLSRSFSMYSNFGVRTPFDVMTAFGNTEMTSNLTNLFIIFKLLHE